MIIKIAFAPNCDEVSLHCAHGDQVSVWPMTVEIAETLLIQLTRSIEMARCWQGAGTLDELIERLS